MTEESAEKLMALLDQMRDAGQSEASIVADHIESVLQSEGNVPGNLDVLRSSLKELRDWAGEAHRKVCWLEADRELFDEEAALAELLQDGVLFANGRQFIAIPWPPDAPKPEVPEIADETVVLFVNCSDIFAWACADAESLPHAEIRSLYEAHVADPKWGSAKWCCRRRGVRPQWPVARDMKKDGSWDEVMESLPVRDDWPKPELTDVPPSA